MRSRDVGRWLGEPKPLGKTPFGGKPSPGRTHVPTFPIADTAPTMLPPVLGKAHRGIYNSQRLSCLTVWCFPPLILVMTIPFCVVGHKREEVGIFIIFPSHVLAARRSLCILAGKLPSPAS